MRARGIETIGIVFQSPESGALDRARVDTAHGPIHHYVLDLHAYEVAYHPEPGWPPAVIQAADRVVEILRAEKPDAVVLNVCSAANAYLARAATLLRIPIFFYHHGLWAAEMASTLPAVALERMRKMESDAIREARTNIYLNEWNIQRVRETYPETSRNDDEVIPLPFNPIFLQHASPTIASDGRPIIGFVARWDPVKNIRLVREFAESARDLHVVSTISIGGRKSLQSEEQPFRSAVDVIEPVSQEALAGLYRSCDLLILPSRFDMLGGVVMEAALQGRGTIISDGVGWVPVYERLGMEEWIVRDPTPERLEAAVRRCLGKPVPQVFVDEILEHHQPDRVFDALASLLTTRI